MDRIAAIAGTEVVVAHSPNAAAPQLALSHGWRRRDGVFEFLLGDFAAGAVLEGEHEGISQLYVAH